MKTVNIWKFEHFYIRQTVKDLPLGNGAFLKARHHVMRRSLISLDERRRRDFIGRHKFVWSNLPFLRRPLWSEILPISVGVYRIILMFVRINFVWCYRDLVALIYLLTLLAFSSSNAVAKWGLYACIR